MDVQMVGLPVSMRAVCVVVVGGPGSLKQVKFGLSWFTW